MNEARTLATRAAALSLAVPVAIVYAKGEYETWFIAAYLKAQAQPLGRDSAYPIR